MRISEIDQMFVDTLRGADVLQPVNGHNIDQSKGVILVACSDGNQLHDLFTTQVAIQKGQCADPMIHFLGGHGGALKLAPHSPIVKSSRTTDIDLIDEINEAHDMKQTSTVVLYTHVPCGKAYSIDLNFMQVISYQMAAKTRLRGLNPKLKLVCFTHVHHRDGRRRTYYISREAWIRWEQSFNGQAAS